MLIKFNSRIPDMALLSLPRYFGILVFDKKMLISLAVENYNI